MYTVGGIQYLIGHMTNGTATASNAGLLLAQSAASGPPPVMISSINSQSPIISSQAIPVQSSISTSIPISSHGVSKHHHQNSSNKSDSPKGKPFMMNSGGTAMIQPKTSMSGPTQQMQIPQQAYISGTQVRALFGSTPPQQSPMNINPAGMNQIIPLGPPPPGFSWNNQRLTQPIIAPSQQIQILPPSSQYHAVPFSLGPQIMNMGPLQMAPVSQANNIIQHIQAQQAMQNAFRASQPCHNQLSQNQTPPKQLSQNQSNSRVISNSPAQGSNKIAPKNHSISSQVQSSSISSQQHSSNKQRNTIMSGLSPNKPVTSMATQTAQSTAPQNQMMNPSNKINNSPVMTKQTNGYASIRPKPPNTSISSHNKPAGAQLSNMVPQHNPQPPPQPQGTTAKNGTLSQSPKLPKNNQKLGMISNQSHSTHALNKSVNPQLTGDIQKTSPHKGTTNKPLNPAIAANAQGHLDKTLQFNTSINNQNYVDKSKLPQDKSFGRLSTAASPTRLPGLPRPLSGVGLKSSSPANSDHRPTSRNKHKDWQASSLPVDLPSPPPASEKKGRKILTHVIDGFVIQESSDPFPVSGGGTASNGFYSSHGEETDMEVDSVSSIELPHSAGTAGTGPGGRHSSATEKPSSGQPDTDTERNSSSASRNNFPTAEANKPSETIPPANKRGRPKGSKKSDLRCAQCGDTIPHSKAKNKFNNTFCSSKCINTYKAKNGTNTGSKLTLFNSVSSSLTPELAALSFPAPDTPSSNSTITEISATNSRPQSRVSQSASDMDIPPPTKKSKSSLPENTQPKGSNAFSQQSQPHIQSSTFSSNQPQHSMGGAAFSPAMARGLFGSNASGNQPSNLLSPNPTSSSDSASSRRESDTFIPAGGLDPTKWNVEDVWDFVRHLPGCTEYADEFRSQDIDGQALMLLKEEHLMSAMSMKLGPALKICAKINALREQANTNSSASSCSTENQSFVS